MKMKPKFPIQCPSCEQNLNVVQLKCENCSTQISGEFSLPELIKLSHEEQEFILSFLKASGSLKEMAKQMKVSYPTVRNYLDDLIVKIQKNIDYENK